MTETSESYNVAGHSEPTREEVEQARAANTKEIIEPERVPSDQVETGYPTDPDPITVRSLDPAAMSEHERNLRQAEQHNA